MILRLSVVCEAARERPDGRLDLMGVFNELSATGFPAMQDTLTVVFVVEWSDDEAGRQPLRADMLNEAGRKLLTIQGHTDVDERGTARAPAQTRLVMPLEKVVFPEPGRYRFELLAGSDVVEACSFFVGKIDE
jgi:predicted amino acid-binding ACT domain protein